MLFAPNASAAATALARGMAAAAACPAAAAGARSFRALFRGGAGPECADEASCLAAPACWEGLLGRQIVGHASEARAPPGPHSFLPLAWTHVCTVCGHASLGQAWPQRAPAASCLAALARWEDPRARLFI